MFEQIKQNMFTIHGAITSVIHFMIIVGMLASWVFVKVQILDEEVALSVPSATAMRQKLK